MMIAETHTEQEGFIGKKQNDFSIPDFEIEAFARCLLPEIQKIFESEEGRREFSQWKAKQKEEHQN